VRIEFNYRSVSVGYWLLVCSWNVGNFSASLTRKGALTEQKLLLGEDQDQNGHFQRKNSWGISLLSIYHVHKQVSPVTRKVDWKALLFQQTLGFYMVTNIHNFDAEILLAFFYDDRIGTINRLSNHHELENHVHAKTCAVHFMRNHATWLFHLWNLVYKYNSTKTR